MAADTDPESPPNIHGAAMLGSFGVRLATANGIQGGIANPMSNTLPGPAGAAVIGPVTFSFTLTGPNLSGLSSTAFAHSFSAVNKNSATVNAAFKFQGGGAANASGTISNAPACGPAGWYVGNPAPGGMVELVLSGSPGCFGGILVSPDPGPTNVGGVLVPIGFPALVAIDGIIPQNLLLTQQVPIPPNPLLSGITFYCVAALVDSGLTYLSFSDQFTLIIQ
jgi:hypothetical protein